MNEYRVKVTVRNNLILKAIEETGEKSVSQFCINNALCYTQVNNMIAMRDKPIKNDGQFSKIANELMEVLGACPSDLWTSEQLNLKLEKNSHEIFMDKYSLQAAICGEAIQIEAETPDETLCKLQLSVLLKNVINKNLKEKEKMIIDMRFNDEKSYDEIGDFFNLSSARIHQIEAKSLRKIKHFIKLKMIGGII